MARYLLRRLLQSAIVLFLFVTVLFFLVQIIMVGDAANFLAYQRPAEVAVAYRELLGLNLPLGQRYLIWLGDILRGDLGVSYYSAVSPMDRGPGVPVSVIVGQGLITSAMNLGIGMVIAYCIGAWLGRVTAWRRGGLLSGAITLVGITLYTSFPPMLAWLIQRLDSRRELFLPRVTASLWREHFMENALWSPTPFFALMIFSLIVTVLFLTMISRIIKRRWRWQLPGLAFAAIVLVIWSGEWAAFGTWPRFIDALRVFGFGPLICVLLFFGETMLVMRTSMTDTLYEDYIFTARAKGLSERAIRDDHAARNAALPALSRLIVNLPYILSGLMIVEYAIGRDGLGGSLFYAMSLYDIPVAMGAILAIGVVAMAARLILDMVIVVLDPRIRFALPQTPQQMVEHRGGGFLQVLLRRAPRSKAGDGLPERAVTKIRATSPSPAPEVFSVWLRRLRQRVRLAWEQAGKSWDIFAENWLAVLGLIMIGIFALMAVAHPILIATVWPRNVYDPLIGFDPMVVSHPAPPSAVHLLGTDVIGRDVLSMLLASTTSSFAVALTAAVVSAVIGTLIGAVSAYYQGGTIDRVFGYLADLLLTLPAPIAMIIIGWRFYENINVFGFGLLYGLIAGASSMAVVMRTLALRLMVRPFIEASRVAGAGGGRIIFAHLVPHMLPLAAVQMMMTVAGAIVAHSYIAWVGITDLSSNWGYMMYFAMASTGVAGRAPLLQLLAPGLALSLFSAAFYLVSRGLHQVAEPRLRDR